MSEGLLDGPKEREEGKKRANSTETQTAEVQR